MDQEVGWEETIWKPISARRSDWLELRLHIITQGDRKSGGEQIQKNLNRGRYCLFVSSSDCHLDWLLIVICQTQPRYQQILKRQCCLKRGTTPSYLSLNISAHAQVTGFDLIVPPQFLRVEIRPLFAPISCRLSSTSWHAGPSPLLHISDARQEKRQEIWESLFVASSRYNRCPTKFLPHSTFLFFRNTSIILYV